MCVAWFTLVVFPDISMLLGWANFDGPNLVTHEGLVGEQASLPWTLLQFAVSVGLFVLCVRSLIKTFKAR
jgi:hypothetical protein